jgi:eukaryotic-like serine/threonine-protein kinase
MNIESIHQVGDCVANRYQIEGILGQGGVGVTYQAEDLQTKEQVALKALSLWRVKDFKVLELFQREARILQQLHHPNIPQYQDYFEVDLPNNRYFYIVQQLAPGQSLSSLIAQDWYPDEATVKDIAVQILEVLIYLQQLVPPVLHRDIKPQNIICQENGTLFLVDFGAVQDTYHNTLTGGSTVVGTYGYMAPEQFRGQATLATDLYSLGATLLFLLSRRDPADLPQRKLKINFRSHVQVSSAFADWLDHLLDPIAEDRFQSAQEALTVLRGEQVYTRRAYQISHRPCQSAIAIRQNGSKLVIEIPPIGLKSPISRWFALLPLISGVFLLLMFLTLFVSTLGAFKGIPILLCLVFASFTLLNAVILARFLLSAAVNLRMEIDPEWFCLKRTLLGLPLLDLHFRTQKLAPLQLKPIALKLNHQQKITTCVLQGNKQQYQFGTLLAEPEKAWLIAEIQAFLKSIVPARSLH